MEINITKIISDMPDAYGSCMTHGENAGSITWNNALNYSKENPLLTDDEVLAVKKHVKDFGAWTDEEIDKWSKEETEALFVQMVLSAYNDTEETYIFQNDGIYYYQLSY